MSAYGIRAGYHIAAREAEPLAKAFLHLEKRLGRPPTPADLLEVANSNHRSAFYRVFDKAGLWDEAFAARQARLIFARKMIEAIEVTISRGNEQVKVRGFVPVRFVDGQGEGYTSTENVIASPERTRAYLRTLQAEARRTAENAGAWAWIVQTNEPASAYVTAAKVFAEAPLPEG